MNLLEFTRQYIEKDWNPKMVDRVFDEIVDVMTGNIKGNEFDRQYCKHIINLYNKEEKE